MIKRILLWMTGILFFLALLIFIFFGPLITQNWGLQPLPDFPKSVELGEVASDSLIPAKQLEELLQRYQKQLNAPALSAAIGKGNQVVWAAAIGFADFQTQQKATPTTRFRIGSISKTVTAMLLGKMMDEDLLDIDQPIGEILTNYSLKHPQITTRQLATHTAGIRHYGLYLAIPAVEGLSTKNYDSVQDALGVFERSPLRFEPGTSFGYSTYGYTLLSAVQEAAAKQPFLQLLAEKLWNPLGMRNTTADQPAPNNAECYLVKDGKYKEAFEVNTSNKWAGGGMRSTPTDLVIMGNALLNNTYFSAAVKAEMLTPQKLSNGDNNPQNYGLGWRIGKTDKVLDDQKVEIYHHGGTITGGIALLILFPEYDLSISIMTNRSGRSGELFKPIYEMAKAMIEASKMAEIH